MHKATVIRATFDASGDFAACRQAEQFLKDMGYSVGRMQGTDPRGILKGDFDIQKWRNLRDDDIAALHGRMTGDMRNGPVHINIEHATDAA